MNKLITSLLLLLSAHCLADQMGQVHWQGSLQAVHKGETQGVVDLQTLATTPNLFALGPLEGLAGEITILDSNTKLSRVKNGQIDIEESYDAQAAFLVWASVPAWQRRVILGHKASNNQELEAILENEAKKAGLSLEEPFPFMIKGTIENVHYHVLAPQTEGSDHRSNAMNISAAALPATIIGFYSPVHQGIFTHRNSKIHMHIIDEQGNAGHLDRFHLKANVKLQLPDW